ncbi:hypothetical protein AMYT_0767 [Malaciobacter mytili LMG 24559]|nr:hypothetical protein [Malaciobacter mytili]AXH14360.1 hypothetical protein AMYT_0767 [Malaciobacter mytili LMG 24559]
MKALLKAKSQEQKKISEIIDEFVKTQSINAKEQLEEFLSDMVVYINRNYSNTDKDALLTIVGGKLKDLNISFDTKGLDDIYKKLSVVNGPSTKFEFDEIDLKAIKVMRDSFYWSADKYNIETQNILKDTISDTFKGEITRAEVSSVLKEKFDGVINKSESYFELVADSNISQAQAISRVNQGLKYGVKHFKVSAKIDNKTSDFCRWLNGKIITANHLKTQIDKLLSSSSIDDKKQAAPWQNKPIYGKLPPNVGLAPYHGHCRTENLPVWINEDDRLDTKTGKLYKVKSTKNDKKYKLRHIDKTGIETKVKPHIYEKIVGGKHGLTEKQLVGALNDIKYKSPHKVSGVHPNEHVKAVALTNSGYTLIYESDELISCFVPTRNANKYFNDNAIENKIINIDTGQTMQRVKKWYEHLI